MELNHEVKVWKIHGDISQSGTIMLGFDQYCQSLKKLMDYMDGKYKSSENNPHSKFSIDQKCKKAYTITYLGLSCSFERICISLDLEWIFQKLIFGGY